MKRYLIFIFWLFTIFPSAFAQSPSFLTDSLDAYIQTGMKAWNIPGLALAIVKDGKIVVAKGYGVRGMGSSKPVDKTTLFQIASQSKLFTAIDLALLEEQKKLSLDDHVLKYLPSFALQNEAATRIVSIRDLLTHRLGLKNYQGDFVYWDTDLTRQDVIKAMRHLKAPYVFRQDFGYSNAGYVVASEIIPKVTGKSWETFTEQTLLKPLSMNRTYMLSAGMETLDNVAQPTTTCCNADGQLTTLPFDNLDNLGPATGMVSDVEDMAKWLQFQLDSGRVNGKELLPWSVLEKTRSANTIVSSDRMTTFPLGFQFYCLGMGLIDYAGKSVFTHAGGSNGYRNNLTLVPEQRLGIIILTNQDNHSFHEALRFQLLDAYLNVPYINRSQYYLSRAQKRDKKSQEDIQALARRVGQKKQPPLPLSSFVGTYRNELYGTLTIATPKDATPSYLDVRFEHHPDLGGKLAYMDGSDFRLSLTNPRFGIFPVTFSLQAGRVDGLTLKDTDFVDHESYRFSKQK